MIFHHFNYHRPLLILALWILILTNVLAQPPAENALPIQFESQGYQLQGWLFTAPDGIERPVVLLLQGAIGTDGDVLGIGEALSSSHYHVLTYNYPGTWRSEGQRSDSSALQSVFDAIRYIKTNPEISSANLNTSDITLAGYSYGGGMALLAASKDSTIQTVISIAGGDLSVRAEQLSENPQFRSQFERMLDNMTANPSMIRGTTGQNYVETLINSGNEYSLTANVDKLLQKRILLISGWYDMRVMLEHHILPLYRELKSNGATKTDLNVLETDHSFSDAIETLHQKLREWLSE